MTATLPWPVQTVADWLPLWKALGFFFATFILEDAAAVGAGVLLATGALSWPAAFAACFLGIWTGDAGLYFLARLGGRRWFERSSWKRFSAKVARSERWFSEKGTLLLVFSRVVPGARLPTYLAAGFLRLPLPRFLVVTGLASCVWTLLVLGLTQMLGAPIARWLSAYRQGGLLLLGGGTLLLMALHFCRRRAQSFELRRLRAALGRLRHWEFWPAWMFYPPVAIYAAWLALKYRGLTLPTTANPGIFSGGIIGESKFALLQELASTSPEFTAPAELVAGGTLEERLATIRKACGGQIRYPFILKPDVGQRGAGIKLVRTEEQAVEYLKQTSASLVMQKYCEGPREAGIFYYRFPNQSSGQIFAITEKNFPTLQGDGQSTIQDLIWKDPRARLIANKYLRRLGERATEVLPLGQRLRLVQSGNHAQGCIFRDGSHLWTPELAETIDGISKKLSGFFIGRYDIRYASDEDLRAGKNFQIIELNGAASEATSIYDSRNSLATAYRTLFRQWDLVFAIGAANRDRGIAPTRVSLVFREWRHYGRLEATYPVSD